MKASEPLAKKANVTVEQAGDETIVYDSDTHKAVSLNRIAAMVWSMCDGETAPESIAAQLREQLDPAADLAVVELALERLGEAGLLMRAPARQPSRREVAAGAFLIPVVTAILIPTPAAAKSGKTNGHRNGPKPGRGRGKGH